MLLFERRFIDLNLENVKTLFIQTTVAGRHLVDLMLPFATTFTSFRVFFLRNTYLAFLKDFLYKNQLIYA